MIEDSNPPSAAGTWGSEHRKPLLVYKTTTSGDTYSLRAKMALDEGASGPFARFQEVRKKNPMLLSCNENLAKMNFNLDESDQNAKLSITTTNRSMNEWVENLSQTPNKGSWSRSLKSREAYHEFARTGPIKSKSGLIGEKLSLSDDPAKNTMIQRSWLYCDDPALMHRLSGVPTSETAASASFNLGQRDNSALSHRMYGRHS